MIFDRATRDERRSRAADPHYTTCDACGGDGDVAQQARSQRQIDPDYAPCESCDGTGYIARDTNDSEED